MDTGSSVDKDNGLEDGAKKKTWRDRPRKGAVNREARISLRTNEENLRELHDYSVANGVTMADFVIFACRYVIRKGLKLGFQEPTNEQFRKET